jgi:pheromone shutdown-related protein TraB
MDGVIRSLKELNKKGLKKEIKELEVIPEKKSSLKYIGYLIPILFFGIVIYGFFTKGIEFTLKVFFVWIMVNGTLSALGAALALAHPVSILVAFVAAPITSLNPTIAAGWFAGLAEIKFRKPKIKDFEGLNSINGFTDLWKNGVTRIILVVAFSNIGSTIGTIYVLPYIISLL